MKLSFAKVIQVCLLLTIHWPANASPIPVIFPCDGCNVFFSGLPSEFVSHTRIASIEEAGEPLHLKGRVLDVTGAPAPGIVVYAYQANRDGVYPQNAQRSTLHGTLRAWVVTDSKGQYSFDTIRPRKSDNAFEGAHIHLLVAEGKRCLYTVDGVALTDDPPSSSQRQFAKTERGGTGKMLPTKDRNGVWQAIRDIQLGRNIPGYEKCGQN